MLVDSAHTSLNLDGLEKESAFRLVHFGQRRAEGFFKYDYRLTSWGFGM